MRKLVWLFLVLSSASTMMARAEGNSLKVDIHCEGQAFATAKGHKVLLINKRNRPAEVTLPQGGPYALTVVDGQTGENAPQVSQETGSTLKLSPFAVAVLTWK